MTKPKHRELASIDGLNEYQLIRYIIYKLRRKGYRRKTIKKILSWYQ